MSDDMSKLVWIDLEMSGLEPERDVILEIATVVTDSHLSSVTKGPDLVVHQPDEVLDNMDEWNTTHHGDSGLTDAVRESSISLEQAEAETISFLKECGVEPNQAPLCGNSITQDRRFLYKYMPELSAFLHYRNIDVSTIKELVLRWYDDVNVPKKGASHRAMDDILESIEELRYYRNNIMR